MAVRGRWGEPSDQRQQPWTHCVGTIIPCICIYSSRTTRASVSIGCCGRTDRHETWNRTRHRRSEQQRQRHKSDLCYLRLIAATPPRQTTVTPTTRCYHRLQHSLDTDYDIALLWHDGSHNIKQLEHRLNYVLGSLLSLNVLISNNQHSILSLKKEGKSSPENQSLFHMLSPGVIDHRPPQECTIVTHEPWKAARIYRV